ncbi:hypothetical protein H4Q26_006793 [Puccinia striiformis f. sp. tritici PST-130]|nr:hypothetical protein H4Q26_006793 [Puccinia striiformis f. sp. tritici PST-130]
MTTTRSSPLTISSKSFESYAEATLKSQACAIPMMPLALATTFSAAEPRNFSYRFPYLTLEKDRLAVTASLATTLAFRWRRSSPNIAVCQPREQYLHFIHPSISDEEDMRLSLVTLTEVHLPEVKQLPSPMIGPNFGCASNAHSLSITTGFYSAKNKLDDDGLDFQYEDSRPSSPDTLHTPDKPFQRHGPSRYIFEDGEQGFAAGSKRGWLNFSALIVIILSLLTAFVVWPVWMHLGQTQHTHRLQLALSRQSGPFLLSQLPTKSLG